MADQWQGMPKEFFVGQMFIAIILLLLSTCSAAMSAASNVDFDRCKGWFRSLPLTLWMVVEPLFNN